MTEIENSQLSLCFDPFYFVCLN